MLQVVPYPTRVKGRGGSRCSCPGDTGGVRTQRASSAARDGGSRSRSPGRQSPAPGRRPAPLRRALAAAADMMVPVLADVAVASTRRLLERRHRVYPVAVSARRQLASAARELPRPERTP